VFLHLTGHRAEAAEAEAGSDGTGVTDQSKEAVR
jgi:hypothetical protein